MLICVTLPEAARATQGGETRVEVSPGHEVLSKATSTPGSALLFRKVHRAHTLSIQSSENMWMVTSGRLAVLILSCAC